MTKQEFAELVGKGIVIMDGATGSNLRKAGMPIGVSSELWNIEHPEVVTQLQRDYAEAGSQIIYAPTFMANRIGLATYGLEDQIGEINRKLVAITKAAVGGKAYVAGDITTTGKVLEPVGDMTYDTLLDIYKEQIRILVDAGVDLLGAETMISVDETTAAVDAANAVCDLPVICTLTLNSDGTLIYGGRIEDAVETLQEMGVSAVGLNCSVGPDQLVAVVRAMKRVAKVPIIVKPNAGLPLIDNRGIAHYDMSPESFVEYMKYLIDAGADIVGGCCGTSPEYIRLLAESLRK